MSVKQKRKKPGRAARRPGSVTVEHALELAQQLHRSGVRTGTNQALKEAEVLYGRILEAIPAHADALHYLGVLMHQTGRPKEAVETIRRSLQVRPDHADSWNNLGNVLTEQQQPVEAAEAYRKALELRPEHADAWTNLGAALKASGDYEQAVDAYERALATEPSHPVAHHNLGNALSRLGRRDEAIGHYRAAIALDPTHPESRKLLSLALFYSGQVEQAIEVLRAWVALEPDNPVATHMLAACSGNDVPSRASDGYVQASFDAMSHTFDEHLKDLGYRAPELVGAAVAELTTAEASLDVLDAGCGTGLCAPMLRPYAKSLVGVDLSDGMLVHARALHQYDELLQVELTAYLASARGRFDLIVSADTLCYFGDLTAFAEHAQHALRPSGRLVFTVEKGPGAEGFVLHPHGRYSHTPGYLREVLGRGGFEGIELRECTLREERGEPVAGLVVTARAEK